MKNFKRYAALLGVILLLGIFCLPMVFALGDSEYFNAALAAAFFVPIMAFVIMMVYRILDRRRPEKEEGRMIENIIFDVGNVLLDYAWEPFLRSFGFPEDKFQKIADATFLSDVWIERDRGLYEEEEYLHRFTALAPEYESEIREVVRRSPETVHKLPYAETWVKYLKNQGYRLYIVSNYPAYILEQTRGMMDFLKYMDGVIFSCEVKEVKPEPGIFRKLLENYPIEPERSVFLDDRKENCEAAEALGIRAIRFRNLKQAAAELEKLGVK